jgi:hypothetical protein
MIEAFLIAVVAVIFILRYVLVGLAALVKWLIKGEQPIHEKYGCECPDQYSSFHRTLFGGRGIPTCNFCGKERADTSITHCCGSRGICCGLVESAYIPFFVPTCSCCKKELDWSRALNQGWRRTPKEVLEAEKAERDQKLENAKEKLVGGIRG